MQENEHELSQQIFIYTIYKVNRNIHNIHNNAKWQDIAGKTVIAFEILAHCTLPAQFFKVVEKRAFIAERK